MPLSGNDRLRADQRQGLRRGLLAGVLVIGFLLLFSVWQALEARIALSEVATRMTMMVHQLSAGKTKQASVTLQGAADSAEKAHAFTRGPVWWTASKLPWLGDDVTAVRTVSQVADDLTSDTLPDMLEAGRVFGPRVMKPRHGRFELEPLTKAAPTLAQGATDIAGYTQEVDRLDTTGLFGPIRRPVKTLQAKFDAANAAANSASIAAGVLPPMMGAGG